MSWSGVRARHAQISPQFRQCRRVLPTFVTERLASLRADIDIACGPRTDQGPQLPHQSHPLARLLERRHQTRLFLTTEDSQTLLASRSRSRGPRRVHSSQACGSSFKSLTRMWATSLCLLDHHRLQAIPFGIGRVEVQTTLVLPRVFRRGMETGPIELGRSRPATMRAGTLAESPYIGCT